MAGTPNQRGIKRALVIGNQNYENKPLRTARKDAQDITTVLQRIGFRVTSEYDCSRDDMIQLRDKMIDSICKQDLFLFYFAGHGIQSDGANYLVPIEATTKIKKEEHIRDYCLHARQLLDDFARKVSHVIIFILDCCRDNPIRNNRGGGGAQNGLASMQARGSTLIQFACSPGTTADDGNDPSGNSLFTKYLLKHLSKPKTPITDIFAAVTRDVYMASEHKQLPSQINSMMIEGPLYLNTDDHKQNCK